MTVWDRLVGQDHVVGTLRAAAAGQGMTHAWLFTGPPGSGRSVAALAFAAALQCTGTGPDAPGCGRCEGCVTTQARTHPDFTLVRTEKLSIGAGEIRDLVLKAALSPFGQTQVIIVEDADRLTEQAGNALLKAVEEPSRHTVFLLCAPTVEDVLVTIRSRCRAVTLATPTAGDVTRFLVEQAGIQPSLAAYAARASQGHIGRARALATDEATRNRRREIVQIPVRLAGLGACMAAAADVVDVATEEAGARTDALDVRDRADLDAMYGVEARGRRPREYAPALKGLETEQRIRRKRAILDVVDGALMDLISVYRDAIALAAGASGELVNEEMRADVTALARVSSPEQQLRRIERILEARIQMLESNVPALLALESMMVGLVLEHPLS